MSEDGSTRPTIVCNCNHCSGHLAFDPSLAGQTTQCPHCGVDTILFIPQAPPAPKPEPKKTKRMREPIYKELGIAGHVELSQATELPHKADLEEQLESAGGVILFLGILGAFIGAAAALSQVESNAGLASLIFLAGLAGVFQAAVIRVLFRGAAEIIRLLKELRSTRISGKILQLAVDYNYRCGICNTPVSQAQENCSHCGATFTD